MANKDTSINSTRENPSTVVPENGLDLLDATSDMSSLNTHGQLNDIPNHGFSYPDAETKGFTTEKAQGLPKPCPKKTKKPSKSKDKPNEVKKVLSAAEMESDQWVWKQYGTRKLKGIDRPRRYYKCELACLEYEKCEARKKVNESCTHPNAYDVAYIGNHNHSPPTHSSYPIMKRRTRRVKIKIEED
ncbi:hypothetical protein POM88_049688 [Heracleum sosnowskyi]|uniref:WRKY domain-containing protein n=1 Tax=Heracleum sosnowskyi TaxID=360622 RepID=A0AAD8M1S9_9APIA|nr:hypothetical protein POM88_049688 [Heracleum sosnowskyi]